MGILGLPPRTGCNLTHLAEKQGQIKLREFSLVALSQGVATAATSPGGLAIVILSHSVDKTDRDGIAIPLYRIGKGGPKTLALCLTSQPYPWAGRPGSFKPGILTHKMEIVKLHQVHWMA